MGNCLGGNSYSYVNKVSSTARPGESSPLLLALLSLSASSFDMQIGDACLLLAL